MYLRTLRFVRGEGDNDRREGSKEYTTLYNKGRYSCRQSLAACHKIRRESGEIDLILYLLSVNQI